MSNFYFIKCVLFFVCVVLLCSRVRASFSQMVYQNVFPSAKAYGLGQSGIVEIYNLSALYWNPAALSFVHNHQSSFTVMPPFQLESIGYAGFIPFRGTFAFHFASIGNGGQGQVASAGWGRRIGRSAHFGMAAHFYQYNRQTTTNFSFGLLVRPISSASFASSMPFGIHSLFVDRLTLAATFQGFNIGQLEMESQLQFGASYNIHHNWPKIVYAFQAGNSLTSHHFGLLYQPLASVSLYGGLSDWQVAKTAAGMSWGYQNINLDLSYGFKEKMLKITTTFDIGPPARELSARAYANAYAHLQDNRLAKAYEYCKKSLEYDVQNILADDILANLKPQLQEQRRVVDSLMTAARLNIEKRWYISAANNYMKILHLDSDNIKAQKALKTIAPFVNEHADKWFELGQQYYEQGHFEQAKEVIESILLVRPDNLDAVQFMKQINGALQKKAQDYFYAGLGFYQQKKYDQAEAQFTQALIIDPNFVEASRYLNLINSERSRIEELVAKNLSEGDRMLNTKDWNRALEKYQEILKLIPDHPVAKTRIEELQRQRNAYLEQLSTRAEAARQRGDKNTAKKLLREILEIRSTYPGARRLLEQLSTPRERAERFIELSKQYCEQYRWESAVVALDSAQKYHPNSAEVKRLRSRVYEKLPVDRLMLIAQSAFQENRYIDAKVVVNVILSKDPTHHAAKELAQQCQARIDRLVDEYFNRGIQLFTEEKYREAIAEWQKGLALNPSHRGSLEYKKRAEDRLRALRSIQ